MPYTLKHTIIILSYNSIISLNKLNTLYQIAHFLAFFLKADFLALISTLVKAFKIIKKLFN
jgi:hypothetical protein